MSKTMSLEKQEKKETNLMDNQKKTAEEYVIYTVVRKTVILLFIY